MESVLDSLEAAVLAVDPDMVVQAVNGAAEQLFGRSRERLRGRALTALGPDGEWLAAFARRCLSSAASIYETRPRLGEVQASGWWRGGELAGVVLMATMHETSRAGSDLPTLAAGLAHEIRNPLAALRGAAELLNAEVSENRPSSPEYVALILREVGRVDGLVGRMLALSRPPALSLARLRLPELVHDLATHARALAAARGAAIELVERFDPALPETRADRARLFEALVNLVKNAVEAAPRAGGRVELEARVASDWRRRGPDGRALPLLELVVRDNGPGLPEAADRLFTPFFTTKQDGTGLGLLLARQAIESHGGRLALRNRVAAEGAEAHVLLPIGSEHG